MLIVDYNIMTEKHFNQLRCSRLLSLTSCAIKNDAILPWLHYIILTSYDFFAIFTVILLITPTLNIISTERLVLDLLKCIIRMTASLGTNVTQSAYNKDYRCHCHYN